MRVNPLPFVFAPGVALAGYVTHGVDGVLLATLVWAGLVAVATHRAYLMRAR